MYKKPKGILLAGLGTPQQFRCLPQPTALVT